MRKPGSGTELERIRRRAVDAVNEGVSRSLVAKVMDVHPGTLSRWVSAFRRDPASLAAKEGSGRPPRLSKDDLEKLAALLGDGPRRFGWSTDIWTTPRIAEVIEREFGVRFHPDHVFKILTSKLKWSWQKPGKRAREQDPEAVATWVASEWPDIKKKQKPRARRLRSSTRVSSC